MTFGDVFFLLIRWFHGLAAVAWVGGSLFYVLVMRPAQRKGWQGFGGQYVMDEFRVIVDTSIVVLVATGTIMLFDRLTFPSLGANYLGIVVVKIALAIWMFSIAKRRWRSKGEASRLARESSGTPNRVVTRVVAVMSGVNMTAILGVTVFLLSDMLKLLFELGLTDR